MRTIAFRTPDRFAAAMRKRAIQLGRTSMSRYLRGLVAADLHRAGNGQPAPEFKYKTTLPKPRV